MGKAKVCAEFRCFHIKLLQRGLLCILLLGLNGAFQHHVHTVLDVRCQSELFRLRKLRKGSISVLHHIHDLLEYLQFFCHEQHFHPLNDRYYST